MVYQGTVEPGDLERAADARPGGKIGVLGSELNHSTVGGLAQSGPLGRSVNSPLIAWAPGMEPPGWGEQPYLPMKAYLPGQEPPGFNEGPWQLTRAELGAGGEVIIPGTGPWRLTGAQTDIAWAPGMEPPGWGEQPYLPMMAYAGDDPWAGLPWWIGRPMGATALVARPGDDPPPPPNQWNWREARPVALGATPLGLGAMALDQGGYEMGPYRPPDTGLSAEEQGFVQRELVRWGRGIGMGALGGAGMGYYGGTGHGRLMGTVPGTDGSITAAYWSDGTTYTAPGGADSRSWWEQALDNPWGILWGALAFVATALTLALFAPLTLTAAAFVLGTAYLVGIGVNLVEGAIDNATGRHAGNWLEEHAPVFVEGLKTFREYTKWVSIIADALAIGANLGAAYIATRRFGWAAPRRMINNPRLMWGNREVRWESHLKDWNDKPFMYFDQNGHWRHVFPHWHGPNWPKWL